MNLSLDIPLIDSGTSKALEPLPFPLPVTPEKHFDEMMDQMLSSSSDSLEVAPTGFADIPELKKTKNSSADHREVEQAVSSDNLQLPMILPQAETCFHHVTAPAKAREISIETENPKPDSNEISSGSIVPGTNASKRPGVHLFGNSANATQFQNASRQATNSPVLPQLTSGGKPETKIAEAHPEFFRKIQLVPMSELPIDTANEDAETTEEIEKIPAITPRVVAKPDDVFSREQTSVSGDFAVANENSTGNGNRVQRKAISPDLRKSTPIAEAVSKVSRVQSHFENDAVVSEADAAARTIAKFSKTIPAQVVREAPVGASNLPPILEERFGNALDEAEAIFPATKQVAATAPPRSGKIIDAAESSSDKPTDTAKISITKTGVAEISETKSERPVEFGVDASRNAPRDLVSSSSELVKARGSGETLNHSKKNAANALIENGQSRVTVVEAAPGKEIVKTTEPLSSDDLILTKNSGKEIPADSATVRELSSTRSAQHDGKPLRIEDNPRSKALGANNPLEKIVVPQSQLPRTEANRQNEFAPVVSRDSTIPPVIPAVVRILKSSIGVFKETAAPKEFPATENVEVRGDAKSAAKELSAAARSALELPAESFVKAKETPTPVRFPRELRSIPNRPLDSQIVIEERRVANLPAGQQSDQVLRADLPEAMRENAAPVEVSQAAKMVSHEQCGVRREVSQSVSIKTQSGFTSAAADLSEPISRVDSDLPEPLPNVTPARVGISKDDSATPVFTAGKEAAKQEQPMKFTEERNKFAGSTLQNLPRLDLGGNDFVFPVEKVKSAFTPRGDKEKAVLNVPSPDWAATLKGVDSVKHFSVEADSAFNRVPAQVDQLARLVSNEVFSIKQSGARSVTVSLKIDARTEISLGLIHQDGRVQASIQCERGDLSGVEGHWVQLQDSLARHNVELLPLQQNHSARTSESSASDSFNFEQPRERERENRSFLPDEEFFPALIAKDAKPNKTNKGGGRAWESWA